MKTLIVVDVQNDFINLEWGKLYVPNGEEVVNEIIKYIRGNADELREVIFTLDWHPNIDSVFIEPKVTWPKHCLQFSEGAAIPHELINACLECNIPMQFFLKGNDTINGHTEYGAFDHISNTWGIYNNENNNEMIVKAYNMLGDSYVWMHSADEFVVGGVAGDYCVLNTIKNLQKYNDEKLKITPFLKGIRSIDGGETLDNFIKKNNLKTV